MHCQICCLNEGFYEFDDEEYSTPLINSRYYTMLIITGYNWVINPNSYNACFVCYDCLLQKIYECNIIQKYYMIKELHIFFVIKKIILKYNIPSELSKIIKLFLNKKDNLNI